MKPEDSKDGQAALDKRAAKPQGVPDLKDVEQVLPNFLHLSAEVSLGKEEAPNPAFPYGSTPIRGVNLGGWLVRECYYFIGAMIIPEFRMDAVEPWITPSIFSNANDSKVVDESTYGEHYGPVEAARQLTQHWDTWITEDDLAQIAALGLNHVRIPIGWWALDKDGTEPYPQGQYPYLFKAVEWAKKHGLKVMIDLHGAPGSQNGFDK